MSASRLHGWADVPREARRTTRACLCSVHSYSEKPVFTVCTVRARLHMFHSSSPQRRELSREEQAALLTLTRARSGFDDTRLRVQHSFIIGEACTHCMRSESALAHVQFHQAAQGDVLRAARRTTRACVYNVHSYSEEPLFAVCAVRARLHTFSSPGIISETKGNSPATPHRIIVFRSL